VSGERPRWLVAAVFGLVVMMTWTVVVKYVVPLAWLAAERAAGRQPAAAPVMWDLWPLAHLALAVLLWRRHRHAWAAGVAVAAVESVIVVAKLGAYLRAPARDLWSLLWASNKVFVLLYFLWLLAVLLRRGRAAVGAARAPELARA
jgi:hypothetical protein